MSTPRPSPVVVTPTFRYGFSSVFVLVRSRQFATARVRWCINRAEFTTWAAILLISVLEPTPCPFVPPCYLPRRTDSLKGATLGVVSRPVYLYPPPPMTRGMCYKITCWPSWCHVQIGHGNLGARDFVPGIYVA